MIIRSLVSHAIEKTAWYYNIIYSRMRKISTYSLSVRKRYPEKYTNLLVVLTIMNVEHSDARSCTQGIYSCFVKRLLRQQHPQSSDSVIVPMRNITEDYDQVHGKYPRVSEFRISRMREEIRLNVRVAVIESRAYLHTPTQPALLLLAWHCWRAGAIQLRSGHEMYIAIKTS